MKKMFRVCIFIVVLLSILLSVFSCKSELKSGKEYFLYQNDMKSNTFVKLGSYVVFTDDFSVYEYLFNDGSLTIRGSVIHHTDPDTYTLICSQDAITVVQNKYRQQLIDQGATDDEIRDFDVVKEGVSPVMQLYYYGGKLFAGNSIELYHSSSSENSDTFEGEFVMTANGKVVLLKGGVLYTRDSTEDEYEKGGYYTVRNNIMTLTMVDSDGKDLYNDGVLSRKKYFMAKITFSDEVEIVDTDFEEQMEVSDWYRAINNELDSCYGKTITVLTDQFFSAEMD